MREVLAAEVSISGKINIREWKILSPFKETKTAVTLKLYSKCRTDTVVENEKYLKIQMTLNLVHFFLLHCLCSVSNLSLLLTSFTSFRYLFCLLWFVPIYLFSLNELAQEVVPLFASMLVNTVQLCATTMDVQRRKFCCASFTACKLGTDVCPSMKTRQR